MNENSVLIDAGLSFSPDWEKHENYENDPKVKISFSASSPVLANCKQKFLQKGNLSKNNVSFSNVYEGYFFRQASLMHSINSAPAELHEIREISNYGYNLQKVSNSLWNKMVFGIYGLLS